MSANASTKVSYSLGGRGWGHLTLTKKSTLKLDIMQKDSSVKKWFQETYNLFERANQRYATRHLAASIRRGTNFQLIFSITRMVCGETIRGKFMNLCDMCLACFEFEMDDSSKCKLVSKITFRKHEKAKETLIGLKISHAGFEKECTVNEYRVEWMKLGDGIETNQNTICQKKIVHQFLTNVEINLKVYFMTPTPLMVNRRLSEDVTFTDFNLKAEDGSLVAVHKSVMSTHSNVFLAMLNNEWKEITEGTFSIKGVTKQNLQYFKEYMYLQTLPNDLVELQTLLQIANCYMIDNLKAECITKLVDLVTPDNFDDLIDFACLNKLPDLIKAIVTDIPEKIVVGIREK